MMPMSSEQMDKFVSKFVNDAEFRERCKRDMETALKEIGIVIPGAKDMKIPRKYFAKPDLFERDARRSCDESCCQ